MNTDDKRFTAAVAAMQGMIANPDNKWTAAERVKEAFIYADMLMLAEGAAENKIAAVGGVK